MTATGYFAGGLSNVMTAFFNILVPPVCPLCRSTAGDGLLCEGCASAFRSELIEGPRCVICGAPFGGGRDHTCGMCLKKAPPFERAMSLFYYRGAVAEAVRHFKYRGRRALGRALGRLLADGASCYDVKFDAVVPVPMHPSRVRKRGFNQTLLLSRHVARVLSIKVDYMNLSRKAGIRPQVELEPGQRKRNVAGAFFLRHGTALKGRRLLVVDDVYTTGATVTECAKVLRKNGARVWVLTLARAV